MIEQKIVEILNRYTQTPCDGKAGVPDSEYFDVAHEIASLLPQWVEDRKIVKRITREDLEWLADRLKEAENK